MNSAERRVFVALGRTFRAERERQGLNQADVAKALGLSQPQLSKMELGRSAWSVMQVLLYSQRLKRCAIGMLQDADLVAGGFK